MPEGVLDEEQIVSSGFVPRFHFALLFTFDDVCGSLLGLRRGKHLMLFISSAQEGSTMLRMTKCSLNAQVSSCSGSVGFKGNIVDGELGSSIYVQVG